MALDKLHVCLNQPERLLSFAAVIRQGSRHCKYLEFQIPPQWGPDLAPLGFPPTEARITNYNLSGGLLRERRYLGLKQQKQ